jgi:hypothetical protein
MTAVHTRLVAAVSLWYGGEEQCGGRTGDQVDTHGELVNTSALATEIIDADLCTIDRQYDDPNVVSPTAFQETNVSGNYAILTGRYSLGHTTVEARLRVWLVLAVAVATSRTTRHLDCLLSSLAGGGCVLK